MPPSRVPRDWALRCISRETREDAAAIPDGLVFHQENLNIKC